MTCLVRRSNLTRDIPDLFSTIFDGLELFDERSHRTVDSAKVDVKEYDDKVEVVADVPGFKKDNINVKFEKGSLILTGELKEEKLDESVTYLHREIGNRSFERRFYFGDKVDPKNIDAHYKDGLLSIVLPKSDTEKYKEITIN